MKMLLALLIVLGSSNAWSCQEMTGTWSCEGSVISFGFETRADGVPLFVGTGSSLIMDGLVHEIAETMHYQVICEPKFLDIIMTNREVRTSQQFTYVDENTLNAVLTLDDMVQNVVCVRQK